VRVVLIQTIASVLEILYLSSVKKILTISLAALYLTLTIGLNIVVHTCGGVSETTVATAAFEDPCGCGDEAPEDKCCTTELTTVHLDDEQQARTATFVQPLTVSDVAMPAAWAAPMYDGSTFSALLPSEFSPPPNNDLCIANSVFRI